MESVQSLMEKALGALKRHWGHTEFRPAQLPAIEAALGGLDVLSVLPTGYGKSVVFQVPAVVMPGCALVISPLIALMKDQVDDCVLRGISASFVNSHVAGDESVDRLARFAAGEFKVFYVTPERLAMRSFLEAFDAADISFLVVDECHCHPAGTRVATAGGTEVAIESLRPGQRVLARSMDGRVRERAVLEVQRKTVGQRQLLRILTPLGSLLLTDDHPVWVVGRGFVAASKVREGDELLRLVPVRSRESGAVLRTGVLREVAACTDVGATQAGVSNLRCGVSAASSRAPGVELLQSSLLAEVQITCGSGMHGVFEACASEETDLLSGMCAGGAAAGGVSADARIESDVRSCGPEAGVGGVEEARAPASGAGWQRDWIDESAAASVESVSAGAGGAVCQDGGVEQARGADWLQGRFGIPERAGGGRVRRGLARVSEGAGCASGREVESVRVAGVEVVERTDRDPTCAGGRDGRVVFALTVEEDHNYFANGLLTHNCVSQWGHDFRPTYMRIHATRKRLLRRGNEAPVIAVTATATKAIEDDIVKGLGMRMDYERVVGDPTRPNLRYEVVRPERMSAWGILEQFMEHADLSQRHVVYTGTRKGADMLASRLHESFGGAAVEVYHAGMLKEQRTEVQDRFKSGATSTVVATCAFGMGIDVPNIRTVVHMGIPGCLEDYVQQSGRAGRDGNPSRVVLITDARSEELQEFFLNIANPPEVLYQHFWVWLCAQLCDSQQLTMSARAIANALNQTRAMPLSVNDGQMSTILNILQSAGLIERNYLPAKTPVAFFPQQLAGRLSRSSSSPIVVQLVQHLLAQVSDTTDVGFQTVYINKSRLSGSLGMSETKLGTLLRSLHAEQVLVVGETFNGKTTKILRVVDDVEEVLPMETLRLKRERAWLRLDAMRDYAASLSEEECREQIREYFM